MMKSFETKNGCIMTSVELDPFVDAEIIVPEGIKRLANNLVKNRTVAVLDLPLSLKAIGFGAFNSCRITCKVDIPKKVTRLDSNCFAYSDIPELSLPDSLLSLGPGAFKCNSLKELVIPKGVEFVGENAFANNDIEKLTLPDDLSGVSSFAFTGNPIRRVRYMGSDLFGIMGVHTLFLIKDGERFPNDIWADDISKQDIALAEIIDYILASPVENLLGMDLTGTSDRYIKRSASVAIRLDELRQAMLKGIV